MRLPIFVEGQSIRALIVGGGNLGFRKARTLIEAGADVTILSQKIHPSIWTLQPCPKVLEQDYDESVIHGFNLIVAATDSSQLNAEITDHGSRKGLWVLNVSESKLGNIAFPAVRNIGGITLAIGTEGSSPGAASEMVSRLEKQLEEDSWPQRIEALGLLRKTIKTMDLSQEERRRIMREALQLSPQELDRRRQDYETQNRDSGK